MASSSAALTQRGLRHAPGLVVELVARDVRLRYRRTFLGVLWSQLTPIAYTIVLATVFTRVVPLGIDHYPAFVLAGLLPWLWMPAALLSATASVVDAPDLVRQPGLPRTALPFSAVAATLVHHVLALPVLFVVTFVAVGAPSATALAIVPVTLVEALLCLGPALLLAAANVRLRDTAHLVGLVLLPLFYATPVFYDAGALSAVPWVRWLNPMVWIIDAHRDALLRQQWPPVAPLAATTAVGVVALLIGLRVYRARMGRFLEHL